MPAFVLNEGQYPQLMAPAGLLLPSGAAPVVCEPLVAGQTTEAPARVNRNAVRLDALARFGAGAYGVAYGLELTTASGLNRTVTAGCAILDGAVVLEAEAVVALADNATSYLWLTRAGNVVAVAGSLTPPATPAAYLGAVAVAAGVQGTEDYSGRAELRGGMLLRRDGDSGPPGDAPPAGVRFLHRNTSGLWLWDGTVYHQVAPVSPPVYAVTNAATDRAFDAAAVTLGELANVVGTLIADLQGQGRLGA